MSRLSLVQGQIPSGLAAASGITSSSNCMIISHPAGAGCFLSIAVFKGLLVWPRTKEEGTSPPHRPSALEDPEKAPQRPNPLLLSPPSAQRLGQKLHGHDTQRERALPGGRRDGYRERDGRHGGAGSLRG